MPARDYSARLQRLPESAEYSVVFRHPTRLDEFGKPGRRVRCALGVADEAEAERLREHIDTLISEPRYHDSAARADAENRFDAVAVRIFFGSMAPERHDFRKIRDAALPLPPRGEADGYRHVLLLGATGAGKTTLVRQIIGIDTSKGERFPSTSTAKTTIHDTEIIMGTDIDGLWRAVVTFVSKDIVYEHLRECASWAALEAYKGSNDTTIRLRLLDHFEQRFRFSYVLGRRKQPQAGLTGFADLLDNVGSDAGTDDSAHDLGEGDIGAVDMDVTNRLLDRIVADLKILAHRHGQNLKKDINSMAQDDDRTPEDLFMEYLDDRLREDESFLEIIDALIDEIEKRFDPLPRRDVVRNEHGWPLSWRSSFASKDEFLKSISRFSSNYAPLYGRLLTPLVNGIRVAWPFAPDWLATPARPKLVLVDGEGLGHTPESSAAVSTSTSQDIQMADAVILVDNATQPMQAGTFAAIREVVQTGNGQKLILAFTHFDEVKGDNFATNADKALHVLASVDNAISSVGKDLGLSATRILRKRAGQAIFFLANLQTVLSDKSQMDKITIGQLRKLLEAINTIMEERPVTDAQPVYSRSSLVSAVGMAVKDFHDKWQGQLGINYKSVYTKAHWQTVKALTRRLAEMDIDEFRNLRPVADLPYMLKTRLYRFLQTPERWIGSEPSVEEREAKYDKISNNMSERFLAISKRRVWKNREAEWRKAYIQRGLGSTLVRANIIADDIYETAAPSASDTTSSLGDDVFLREIEREVMDAMAGVKAKLR